MAYHSSSIYDLTYLEFDTCRALITFGLNALIGRHKKSDTHNAWTGDWDSTNAYDLINYTVSKGYKIDSWEFGKTEEGEVICQVHFCLIGTYSCICCLIGNELSGKGIGASVSASHFTVWERLDQA